MGHPQSAKPRWDEGPQSGNQRPTGCGRSATAPLGHSKHHRTSRPWGNPKAVPQEKAREASLIRASREREMDTLPLARAESLIRCRHTHPCTVSSKFRAMETKPWAHPKTKGTATTIFTDAGCQAEL